MPIMPDPFLSYKFMWGTAFDFTRQIYTTDKDKTSKYIKAIVTPISVRWQFTQYGEADLMNSISLSDYTKTPLGPGLMYLHIQALGFPPLLKGSKQVSGWRLQRLEVNRMKLLYLQRQIPFHHTCCSVSHGGTKYLTSRSL